MPYKNKRAPMGLLLLLMSFVCVGQIAPVRSITLLSPPYGAQLSSWTSNPEKLRVELLLRDLHVEVGPVFLEMHLEGSQAQLRSKSHLNQRIFTLTGGQPLQLSGKDLQDYFKSENLLLQNINANDFIRQGGRLPEGFYKLYFQVFEASTGRKVSDVEMGTSFRITHPEPPFLQKPEDKSLLRETLPQNIFFQWSERHQRSIGPIPCTYEWELVELKSLSGDYAQALFNSLPKLARGSCMETFLTYDERYPKLTPHAHYAFRVRIQPLDPLLSAMDFKNQGYSLIHSFTYLPECPRIARPRLEAVTDLAARIAWDPHVKFLEYTLSFQKRGLSNWFSLQTSSPRVELSDLQPNTSYSAKIQGHCADALSIESDTLIFHTSTPKEKMFYCGKKSEPSPDSCQGKLQQLFVGDVISAKGTQITVTELQKNQKKFTGKGNYSLPLLRFLKINVGFSDITLNRCKELTSGEIISLTSDTANLFWDGDTYFDGGDYFTSTGDSSTDGDEIPSDYQSELTLNGQTQYHADSSRLVITHNGVSDTIHKPKYPLLIKGGSGSLVQVEADGSSRVLSTSPNNSLKDFEKSVAAPPNVATIRFENLPQSRFAIDHWIPEYSENIKLHDAYPLTNKQRFPYKFMLPSSTDVVAVKVDLNDSALDINKIYFQNASGTRFKDYKINDSTLELHLIAGQEKEMQTVKALIRTDSSILEIGRLLIPCYHALTHKIRIIPTYHFSEDLSQLSHELNAIFQPVGISLEVKKSEIFDENSWDLNGNGVLDVDKEHWYMLDSKEVETFKKKFIDQNIIERNCVYVFLLPKAPRDKDGEAIKGFMARKQYYAFLFPEDDKLAARDIAHELGHGLFNLQDTYDSNNHIPKGKTNNLMDIGQGVHTAFWQWNRMRAIGYLWQAFE